MSFVMKTEPYDLRKGSGDIWISARIFYEDFFGAGFVESYSKFFWFFSESKGGQGLFARGQAGPIEKYRDEEDGRRWARLHLRIEDDNVLEPLGKRDFKSLDRAARSTPLEKLNRILYVHSHEKVAPIDRETSEFLRARFP